MATPTRTQVGKPPSRAIAATTLIVGYVLLVPFWFVVGLLFAGHHVPPGTQALFTCGIMLVLVNFEIQRRYAQQHPTLGPRVLMVFLLLMTLGNVAIIIEAAINRVPFTTLDITMVVLAVGATIISYLVIEPSTNFGRWMSLSIAAAICCRALIQVILAVLAVVHNDVMPLDLILFFMAFGLCRFIPVFIQWYNDRRPLTRALLVTEGANMVSLLALLMAWGTAHAMV